MKEENSVAFICKCGKKQGWITEDEITKPCPNCGRKYLGKYNSDQLTIEAIEL